MPYKLRGGRYVWNTLSSSWQLASAVVLPCRKGERLSSRAWEPIVKEVGALDVGALQLEAAAGDTDGGGAGGGWRGGWGGGAGVAGGGGG